MTYELSKGFTVTRILDAAREQVFEAWTDPAQLGWFFNPEAPASTREPVEVDLRPGGVWKQNMVVNDDLRYYTGGHYLEIEPPAKLVFLWGATGGWPDLDPSAPDEAIRVTVILTEVGDRTELTLTHEFPDHFSDEKVREQIDAGMQAGWGMTVDRLVQRFASAEQPAG